MATERQKKAIAKAVENGGNISKAMRESGYSAKTAKTPKKLTESDAWKLLMNKHLADEKLSKLHDELLTTTKIEHMTFPLGPKGEDDPNFSGADPELEDNGDEDGLGSPPERTSLTDAEIIALLADVNCKVKKIVHGNTARHVYFWVIDPKARKEALDMAYKLKGKYAPEKVETTNLQTEEDRVILRDLLREFRKKDVPVSPDDGKIEGYG